MHWYGGMQYVQTHLTHMVHLVHAGDMLDEHRHDVPRVDMPRVINSAVTTGDIITWLSGELKVKTPHRFGNRFVTSTNTITMFVVMHLM